MRNTLLALVAMGLLLGLNGCSKEQSQVAGVALLDLDRVAVAIGWNTEMEESMKQKDAEIGERLTQMKLSFKNQIDAKIGEYGENPNEDQQRELTGMANQANANLQNAVNSARQQTGQYRVTLINDFRDRVRPYAEDEARAKGFATILLKADPVYFFETATDITGGVIARMKAAGEATGEPAENAVDDPDDTAAQGE